MNRAGLIRRPIDHCYRELVGNYRVMYSRSLSGSGWVLEMHWRSFFGDPNSGRRVLLHSDLNKSFRTLEEARLAVRSWVKAKRYRPVFELRAQSSLVGL